MPSIYSHNASWGILSLQKQSIQIHTYPASQGAGGLHAPLLPFAGSAGERH